MEIKLSDVAENLRRCCDVEVYGSMERVINKIERIPHDERALSQNVLYVSNPTEFARLGIEDKNISLLLIVYKELSIPPDLLYGKNAIIAKSLDTMVIFLRLSEITYEAGRISSEFGDIMRAFMECVTLYDLLDVFFQFANTPAAIIEPDGAIREQFRIDGEKKLLWDSIHDAVDSSGGYVTCWPGWKIYNVAADGAEYRVARRNLTDSLRHNYGYLEINDLFSPLTGNSIDAGNLLSRFVVLELMASERRPKRGFGSFLEEMLVSSTLDGREIRRRAEEYGWTSTWHNVICFKHRRPGALAEHRARQLMDELKSKLDGCICIGFDDAVIALLTRGESILMDREQLAAIEETAGRWNVTAGISAPFREIYQFRNGYKQAVKTIELCNALSPDDAVCKYEDYSTYHMLELCGTCTELYSLCHPGMQELLEYEAEKEWGLTDTLRVYLSTGGSKAETARRLFLHQNTVKYRLAIIEELLEVNLRDGDTRLALDLSLKIIRLINGGPYVLFGGI